ncbi:hybrid sensor histidine kinase/response regulator [Dyella monticola]|nr:hybrid sensor histidine kinase/response regulator [Dyella monticola]
MPEPVHHDALTGQQDIASLERHQQRLLYGGGVVLSLIILLILGVAIILNVNNYRSDQVDDFRNAKLALDAVFIQRDAGYIRTLNMIEYAWRNKPEELVAQGADAFAEFTAHDDQAIIQASAQATPFLVLGSGVQAWPKDKVERYLGLARELSIITGTTLSGRGKQVGTMGYFYEPSETLFAFGSRLGSNDLKLAEETPDRAALFSKLTAPNIRFDDIEALRELHKGNKTLPFYGSALPKVLSSIGKDPSTGAPAVIGAFVPMDGDTPIGAFVIYEPVSRFVNQLRNVTPNELTVLTEQGQVVFGTATDVDSNRVAQAFRPLMALQTDRGLARYKKGRHFFVAERIAGTNWTLVRAYTWLDILRHQSLPMLIEMLLTAVLLAVLWALLIRQDKVVFSPMLARAKRVYHSEVLNRTMIETSPVGLCVIERSNAMPLLQNDLVRRYADSDSDVGAFYRRLLESYTQAGSTMQGLPDAREFAITAADANEGAVTHLLVAAKPIIYLDRDALFCVLRDLTARVEIEENLRRARYDSEQAKLAAESASRAKSTFVATMSHEIRTPLNGILGHLELLGHSKLEPSQRERLDRIRLSADTLLAIISDVLDFSRIESGQLDIDPISFDLRSLIEQTVLLYAPTAQRKGLKLYFSIEQALAREYVADAHRIRQVLNNLVSNAVKFTESGRIVLRVSSAPASEAEAAWLRFEVIDSGIGMSESQLRQVFQPFSQADASIARRFGGSGLGLTLCHQLAELMGGRMEARSTPGVGSVFAFDLPVALSTKTPGNEPLPFVAQKFVLLSAVAEWRMEIAALLCAWGADVTVASQPSELDIDTIERADALVIFGAERAWESAAESTLRADAGYVIRATTDGPLLPEQRDGTTAISCYSSAALQSALRHRFRGEGARAEGVGQTLPDPGHKDSRGRVLLVDDNPVNRELIQQQLEILGYGADTAEDGEAALRLWQEEQYIAVLTDINMPTMSGYELAEALRARGVTKPILAVTASALASEKVRCKQAGITDLLLKPLSLEKLKAALLQHLGPIERTRAAGPAWVNKYPEKVRRVFVESGTRDLDVVLQARRAMDTEGLLSRLHSMKGALMMMGEKVLAELCSALEKQVEEDGIEAASDRLDQLESSMRALLERFSSSC